MNLWHLNLEWVIFYKWCGALLKRTNSQPIHIVDGRMENGKDLGWHLAGSSHRFAHIARNVEGKKKVNIKSGYRHMTTLSNLPSHRVCGDETLNWFSSLRFMQFDETTSAPLLFPLFHFNNVDLMMMSLPERRNRSQQWRCFEKVTDGKRKNLLPKLPLLVLFFCTLFAVLCRVRRAGRLRTQNWFWKKELCRTSKLKKPLRNQIWPQERKFCFEDLPKVFSFPAPRRDNFSNKQTFFLSAVVSCLLPSTKKCPTSHRP